MERNPSSEMTRILDDIGVVKMVIDRIGVTYHKNAVNRSKSKSFGWLKMIFYEIRQGLSLVATVRQCSLRLIV